MPWDEEADAWIILSRTPTLGASTVARALERFGAARALLDAVGGPSARAHLPPAALSYLSSPEAVTRDDERAWLAAPDHHVLPCTDARYPARLREAPGHPLALYVAGEPASIGAAQVAVVGSRNPTPQGRDNAHYFSRALAGRGLVVASGLALGIDAEAHRGALAAGGRTIAVLATGIDVIYPRGNERLAREIENSGGALVSGFALGTAPLRRHFAQRNATLAALSLGTLVVEAAQVSGSLITARMTGRLRRPVFAVPGSISNPLARGCHALIREGAILTESLHDICRELAFSAPFCGAVAPAAPAGTRDFSSSGMDKDHKILLDALGFDAADLDQLVSRTGLEPKTVSSMMLILELEGHVQAAPGGRYSRVVRSRR